MPDERFVKPMPNEQDEKKVQMLVRDILAKPGFIRNGAPGDVLRHGRLPKPPQEDPLTEGRRMELVTESNKTQVNGHTIVRDEKDGKVQYFVHTRGVGYWAFYIGNYELAVQTAEGVPPYLEKCRCGAEAHVFSNGKWGVNCNDGCFDAVPASHETRDEAINAWNENN